VVYADRLKTEFADVPEEMVRTEGPVSEPVARALAEGIRKRTGATVGVSITGIAGPGPGAPGPDAEKPIGLVYVGVSFAGEEAKVMELPDGGPGADSVVGEPACAGDAEKGIVGEDVSY
jgi:nicotinamide-nucleotide amidase